MTSRTLIRRSLRFHARSHFGVVLGAAIGSAALIGALVVGDSVRASLKAQALARLGNIHFALNTQDHFFQTGLRERIWFASGPHQGFVSGIFSVQGSSALVFPGVVAKQDGSARANRVNILGVHWPSFGLWKPIWFSQNAAVWDRGETALINETLARQLSLEPSDEIIVRIPKPSALGLDAAISPRDETSVALRLKVGAIVPPDLMGDFSVSAGQPAANLFVPLDFLGKKLGIEGRANVMVEPAVMVSHQLNWFEKRREAISIWFWRHAPPIAINLTSGAKAYKANPGSLFMRVAKALEPKRREEIPDTRALSQLNAALTSAWRLEDAQLAIRSLEPPQTTTGGEYIGPWVQISSERIFLEQPVVSAALTPRTNLLTNRRDIDHDTADDLAFSQMVTNGVPVLTYLANLLRGQKSATPYSMVTAAGAPYTPVDMKDDEILVNEWLADDLKVHPGDSVQLSYFLVDSGSKLVGRTNAFRVRRIVPLKGIYADRTLMPEFPGIAKAESTHEWDAGFPLTYTIREKDEAYWKQYRGTPKAFVTLAAGEKMWANRFGNVTSIRYPVPTNTFASTCREAVYRNLLANLKPEDVGLRFEPVREEALKAAEQAQDFGQLFLGFSIFLVVAALLLMALLFQFGLEQRATEVGTLLALGFPVRQVRRLLLLEGMALALLGGLIGAAGGIAYAKAMLWGLATVWKNAIGSFALSFHITAETLVIGICASTFVAVFTIWITLRSLAKKTAIQLLVGDLDTTQSKAAEHSRTPRRFAFFGAVLNSARSWSAAVLCRFGSGWLALGCGAAALAILVWASKNGGANAGAFFGAGSLLLLSGLALAAFWLRLMARAGRVHSHLTLSRLGVRDCARRRKRSLATIALLASGSFLIVAIGVFRLDANLEGTKRSSGTGGFALIGESTMPIVQDLNTKSGREFFDLDEKDLAGVRFVPFRVREGDEASCLNLNRAQKPRILGVNPELLQGRFTFAEIEPRSESAQGWDILRSSRSRKAGEALKKDSQASAQISNQSLSRFAGSAATEIPAIGDANSIEWAMGKKIGDTIDYTDEQGRPFKLRLVGAVANSILQGSLIIDEAEFIKRFPGESGYRMFLIDAPSNSVSQISATLARAMQDIGLEITPAAQRLNAFNAVQNTYLGTFQVLGGLGLLLGSAGLGVVVLRNVLERRSELGLMVAMGFRRRELQNLLLSEHGALLGLGLAIGIVSAAVAVLPALLSPGRNLPYVSLALTLAAVLLNGLVWTWLATRFALRGDLMKSLRNA